MTYTYEALVCLADKVLPFHFEVALILRSSLLLNGILTNSEAWYGLKISGSIPIRFIVIFKRVMFLHYILNQDQDSLIREAQVRNPRRNYLNETGKKDLEQLKIVKTLGEIKSLKQ